MNEAVQLPSPIVAADLALWKATVERARGELAALPVAEREWLQAQVALIGSLQEELDGWFRAIDGVRICTDCRGGCCSRAKHHVTLTNVLACLLAGAEPPAPDYSLPCPFLGATGCLFPPARRPFNCIIFFCEELDRQLNDEQRRVLGELEARLRRVYEEIAGRCPGAGLRGLLIAAERVGEAPLLQAAR